MVLPLRGRLLAITVLIAGAHPDIARAATQWVRLTTPHFEMLTTAGEKKGREAILYFETVRQFFIDGGFIKNPPAMPVRIIAFRNEKEYRPYSFNEFATAFYVGGPEHDYIVMSAIGSEQYPAAVHEYVHLLVRHSGIRLPVWMNEGLADLYSTLRPFGKKVAFGDPIPGRLFEARDNRLIDLRTLTSVDERSSYYNEKNRASVFYAESWALMHMLYVTPEYRPRAGAFVKAIAMGESAESSFRKVYNKSLEDVQKDLDRYVRGSSFLSVIASVQLDQNVEDPEVQPFTSWDADLALAEVMCSTIQQAGLGRKTLERLSSEEPKRPEPYAMLGEIALSENKTDEALRSFAKAAELGGRDAEMYLHYGMLLRQRGGSGSGEAMVNALRKSAELKPDNPDAHYFLTFAYMDRGDFRQALSEGFQVKHIKPEQAFSFYQATAYAKYRLGDAKQARELIDAARKFARSSADTEQLDRLAEALNAPAPAKDGRTEIHATTAQTGSAEGIVVRPRQFPRMEGTLESVACAGASARLEVKSGGKTLWFLVDKPQSVRITNAGSGSVDFECGKQNSRPVVVEYEDHPDAEAKTMGRVRGIEFK